MKTNKAKMLKNPALTEKSNPLVEDEFHRAISGLAGRFAFHLYDTHGLPKEMFRDKLIGMSVGQLLGLINKHKDFKIYGN